MGDRDAKSWVRLVPVACAVLCAGMLGCWQSDVYEPWESEPEPGPGGDEGAWGGLAQEAIPNPVAADDTALDGASGTLCIAPDRSEYMAEHGVDPGDPEAGDAGKEHTILFIFDKSGSMAEWWEEGTDKWTVAVEAMVDSVTLYQSYLSAGAIFFPTDLDCLVEPIDGGNQIEFTIGSDFLEQWEMATQAYSAGGLTPLGAAFARADEAIRQACADGVLERPFKVVLLTDGEPTCETDLDELVNRAGSWLEHGIETHVFGLPGSEGAAALLDAIADAGGTGSGFSPDDEEDFEDEMNTVCE